MQAKNKGTQPGLMAFWAKPGTGWQCPSHLTLSPTPLFAQSAPRKRRLEAFSIRNVQKLLHSVLQRFFRDGTAECKEATRQEPFAAGSVFISYSPFFGLLFLFLHQIFIVSGGLRVEELDDWWTSDQLLAFEARPTALSPFYLLNQRTTATLHKLQALHVHEDDKISLRCLTAVNYPIAQPGGNLIMRSHTAQAARGCSWWPQICLQRKKECCMNIKYGIIRLANTGLNRLLSYNLTFSA